MFCTNCGFEVDANTNFCTNCCAKLRKIDQSDLPDSTNLVDSNNLTSLTVNDSEGLSKNESVVETFYEFQCSLDEERTNWMGERISERRDATVRVFKDRLVINKTGVFIKSDLGSRTIYFQDISSIDFDKAGIFHITSSIKIILRGGEYVTLLYCDEEKYAVLNGEWANYKENLMNPQPNQSNPEMTNVDELLKYADLYERGFLTQEEFEQKKKELL
ncbi:SHOCT domain-containing protein [Methanobrevibacter ruminantium]|uniref:SHOCT domain-containing protein n=1 Tax=Methanobrevibacter ruminantium TaxID=83816 RepID=UPI0026EDABDD|nr:SHOCT domain-containing protein [Methanobrevibacter ruminantium]